MNKATIQAINPVNISLFFYSSSSLLWSRTQKLEKFHDEYFKRTTFDSEVIYIVVWCKERNY